MPIKTSHRPGEYAPRTGRYEIIGPKGARTGNIREISRGEPLPPTPKPGQRFILIETPKRKSA